MMRTSYLLHYTELALDQRATGRVLGDFELDGPTWLDVEFDINPGQPLILRADPDDCQEGFPTTVTVHKVTVCKAPMKLVAADEMTLTLPTGFDVTEYLSKSVIEMMEEALMSELEAA
jgi:hypothetical protein